MAILPSNPKLLGNTVNLQPSGSEENHKHHLFVDQVQCAKRFQMGIECGGTHIELTANVRDVFSINIGHILHTEDKKHCITKDDREINAAVIAAVSTSFEEDRDCLKTNHSTKSCSERLCIVIDDNIVKFAASTMGMCMCYHKLASNGMKFSTRFLTQQTLYGTRLQGYTIVAQNSDVLNIWILIATMVLVRTSCI